MAPANPIRPDELPWLRDLLASTEPRQRVYGLNAVSGRGTSDDEVLALCERLLDDKTITLLGIPYSFGEVRSCAVEAVLTIRRLRGESVEIVIPDLVTTLRPGARLRAVRERSLAHFDDAVALLKEVAWAQGAEEKVSEGIRLAREYYRRLLPYWPAERESIGPTDPVFAAAAFAGRTEAQRKRIRNEAATLLADMQQIDSTTNRLVPMALAWTMAIDAVELRPEDNPSVPLIDLWCSGFTLQHSKVGIQINYRDGWGTIRFPQRQA